MHSPMYYCLPHLIMQMPDPPAAILANPPAPTTTGMVSPGVTSTFNTVVVYPPPPPPPEPQHPHPPPVLAAAAIAFSK